MDYQKEYWEKNPNMHYEDSKDKVKDILSIIKKIKPESMLDVGCGGGLITNLLCDKLNLKKTTGLDIAQYPINKAIKNFGSKEITWVMTDVYKYQSSVKYDLVIGLDIIEHVEDDVALLKKMGELGRYVVIKTPIEDTLMNIILKRIFNFDAWEDTYKRYGHIHHYNEKELKRKIKDAGFKVIDSKYLLLSKRSNHKLEIIRKIFLPVSLLFKGWYVRNIGGFKLLILSSDSSLKRKK